MMRLVYTDHVHAEIVTRPFLGQKRRVVQIKSAVFVNTGKNYRGRLGAKDQARRAAALAVAA